jgi:hypothetical protein
VIYSQEHQLNTHSNCEHLKEASQQSSWPEATARAITAGMEDCITARKNQAQQNKLHHYISTTETLQESAVRLLTTPAK